MGPIRGLLLDACNILYDDTAWRHWLLRLLMRLGLQTNYRCFFRVFDRDYLGEVHRGRREFGEALGAFLRATGLSHGQIEEVKVAIGSRRRAMENNLRPLTGVRTTLGRLQASGLAMSVFCHSEHSTAIVEQRLQKLFVASPWTSIISSRDLGRAMPDPACYLAAIRAMKISAEQVAFVGHDPAELAGAAALGLTTFAFNSDTDALADIYLQRFEELVRFATPPTLCAAAG